MRRVFSIGKYDVTICNTSRRSWKEGLLKFRYRDEATVHYILGCLSILIEDATAEVYRICAECGSDEIGEQSYGDEGWTVCQACRSVEQGYEYISKRQMEERGML